MTKLTDEQVLEALYEYTIKRIPLSCTNHYVGGEYGLVAHSFGGTWAARASTALRCEIAKKHNVSKQTALNSLRRLVKKGLIQENAGGQGSCYQHYFNDKPLTKIRDFAIEIMAKKGLTENATSFTRDKIEKIWAETSSELKQLITLDEVIAESMQGITK